MECVDELRHRLIEGAEIGHIEEYMTESITSENESVPTDFDSTASQFGSEPKLRIPRSRRASTCSQMADTTYDTFEHCLQKANEMESVLAFYYQDENNPNVLKVTEIFSLDDGHNLSRSRQPSKQGRVWEFAGFEVKQTRLEQTS